MARTGGRQKGTLNKKTVERLAAEAAAGITRKSPDPKRRTSGRQRGSSNKKTNERREKLSEAVLAVLADLTPEAIDAMTPRDVMHLVMTTGLRAGDLKMAYMAATDLAPYFHAKLSAVTVDATINADPAKLSDAELERRIAHRNREIAGGKRARVVH